VVVLSGQSRLQSGSKGRGPREDQSTSGRPGQVRQLIARGAGAHEHFDRRSSDDRSPPPLLTAAFVLGRSGGLSFPARGAVAARVDFPTINVTAKFPGASPETMATTVAQPLRNVSSRKFRAVAQLTSISVMGPSRRSPCSSDLERNIDCPPPATCRR